MKYFVLVNNIENSIKICSVNKDKQSASSLEEIDLGDCRARMSEMACSDKIYLTDGEKTIIVKDRDGLTGFELEDDLMDVLERHLYDMEKKEVKR